MKYIPTFERFLLEGSGEVLDTKRGDWLKIDPGKHPELSNEFFGLINTAYHEIGGFAKIKKPSDIFADPEWTYWEGVDIHGSPDLDLIIFGKDTKYGVKFSGMGHDGEKDSKKLVLDTWAEELKKLGYYVEASGKLAEILINKYHVPIVEDYQEVKKVLGKEVEWHGKNPFKDVPGNGWYVRTIGGESHDKILLGKPKI